MGVSLTPAQVSEAKIQVPQCTAHSDRPNVHTIGQLLRVSIERR
jgi:hypothetical protein